MLTTQLTTELTLAIWNDRDYDALAKLYAANFVMHNPQNPIQGRAAYLAFCKEVHTAFPDFHLDVHETMHDGEFLAARWTIGGTHEGAFKGIEATGKSVVMSGMTMSRFMSMDEFTHFDGNAIVEAWQQADDLGMMQQLGVIAAE